MFKQSLIAFGLVAVGASAQAQTITQWNFNSTPSDASFTTGTLLPSTGSGSLSLLGGVTSTFASGDVNGGSSDPTTDSPPTPTNDSGLNTTTYAAQGTNNNSRGVRFNVSTVGYENVTLSYDLRHSNTSSRFEQVQYTLDGTSFIDIATFSGNDGDTWFNSRTVDLSSIAASDNNALFGFRVVSTFAPNTSTYLASEPGANYAPGGTWRFDMVTVSGAAVSAVPEPQSYALMLAGLAVVGGVARRRARRD